MKNTINSLLLTSTLAFSSNVLATNDITVGVGLGSLYTGVGVNMGVQSSGDLKYVSLGCVLISSMENECGMGVGWVNTNFFDFQSTRHGLSVYAGLIGSERTSNYGYESVYGAGLGYHYFFNGINASGTNLGFTLVTGAEESSRQVGGMFQAGYQF